MPPSVSPESKILCAIPPSFLSPCGKDEHGREKLGQHLVLRLRDNASWLGLIPVEQETIEAFAVEVAVSLARNVECA